MKKILNMLFIFCLVACTSDEIIQSSSNENIPIDFKPYIHKQTKAGLVDPFILQTDGFKVTAAFTGTDDMDNTKPLNLFNDEQVSYSSPNWVYTNTQYWPASLSEKISFFAYADGSLNLSTKNSVGYPQVDFTVADAQTDQLDFIVSSLPNQTRPLTNTPVIFDFNHALSGIYFSVRTDHMINKIYLNDMFINKKALKNKGTFTYSDDFSNSDWALDMNSNHADYQDTIFTASTNTEVPTNSYKALIFGADDNYEMILPQEIPKTSQDSVPITLNFSIETPGGALLPGYQVTSSMPATTLQKGKLYEVRLLLKVDEILSNFVIEFGDPIIQNWTTVNTNFDVPQP